jgi:hypothetical protein
VAGLPPALTAARGGPIGAREWPGVRRRRHPSGDRPRAAGDVAPGQLGRRAGLARSLSRTVIDLSRRELATRMPGALPEEVRLRRVELNYGAELAARLRAFLAAPRG